MVANDVAVAVLTELNPTSEKFFKAVFAGSPFDVLIKDTGIKG